MRKRQKTNIAACLLFLAIAFLEIVSVVIYPIMHPAVCDVPGSRYGIVILPLHVVLSVTFFMLSVVAFRPGIRPLSVIGFGVGAVGTAVLLTESVVYLRSYLNAAQAMMDLPGAVRDTAEILKQSGVYTDYLKQAFFTGVSQTDSAGFLAIPMPVALIYTVITVTREEKMPLKTWYVPGLVAAVCALFCVGIHISAIILTPDSFIQKDALHFWQGISPLFILAEQPLFAAGVFCFMKQTAEAA